MIGGDGRQFDILDGRAKVYRNDKYTVSAYDPEFADPGNETILVHLSIRRNDGAACRDWRDFQQIKNEICGPEAEGVEIYPAESRLVDGANQYHLWVLLNAMVPLGFRERLVSDSQTGSVQQRAFEEPPADMRAITQEEMNAALAAKGWDG